MFSSNKKKTNTPTTAKKPSNGVSPINALNSIVQGTTLEGNVKAESDIRIDGIIKGNLECSAKVIIGPSGFVEGNITCANAMIEGRFEGIIEVKELLNVRETAEITGEIYTNKLIVQQGAVFNVTCAMGNQQINAAKNKQTATTKVLDNNKLSDAEAKGKKLAKSAS